MNLVQLTLVAPRHLEDALVESLLAHPEWDADFTLGRVEGHGAARETMSARERVRGRTERCELRIVLEAEQAQRLLDGLKESLPGANVGYCIVPVMEMGRLA